MAAAKGTCALGVERDAEAEDAGGHRAAPRSRRVGSLDGVESTHNTTPTPPRLCAGYVGRSGRREMAGKF
jgi:hypothetical protein